jgi:hypothetical protein
MTNIETQTVVWQGSPVEAVVGVSCPECAGLAYVSRAGGIAELHAFTCSMPDFAMHLNSN